MPNCVLVVLALTVIRSDMSCAIKLVKCALEAFGVAVILTIGTGSPNTAAIQYAHPCASVDGGIHFAHSSSGNTHNPYFVCDAESTANTLVGSLTLTGVPRAWHTVMNPSSDA